MIAFITTLRHPTNSASYDRVERLLSATLESVANQTTTDFVVIVVGNREPAFELPSRVHYVNVEFPAPAPPTGPSTPRTAFVRDKGTKVGVGLLAAKEFDPDHVMLFDADDYVSREVAAFVSSHGRNVGWVVDSGLMFSSARNSYRAIKEFNRTCGTSFVVPYSAYQVPDDLTVRATQSQIEAAFGERLWRIMGAHRDAATWFAEHGVEIRSLPFPGAVYHVDTGENHSGKALAGVAMPLSKRVAAEYSIKPTLSPVETLWAAIAPSHFWDTARQRLRHHFGRRR